MKLNHFFLHEFCLLEDGLKGSCIYDLVNKKLYSIDNEIGRVIRESETKDLNYIFERFDSKKKINIFKYLTQLKSLNLGDFYKNRVVIEKIQPGISKQKLLEQQQNAPLNRVWLEVENRCNFRFYHCESHVIERCSCNLLSQNKINKKRIVLKDYYNVIRNASLFGCREIAIIGGEPLLSKALVMSIIRFARKLKIPQIVLYSNGLLFNNNILDLLKKYNVTWQSNFYANYEQIHHQITQTNETYKKQVENYCLALRSGINLKVNIEVMNINQDYISDTIDFLRNLGVSDITRNYVTAPDYFPQKFVHNIIMNKQKLRGISKEVYYKHKEGHTCWDGQFAVTIYGDILPCPMARKEIPYNINVENINTIFRTPDLSEMILSQILGILK